MLSSSWVWWAILRILFPIFIIGITAKGNTKNAIIDKVRNTITSAIQVLERQEKPETPKPKEKTIDLPDSGEKFQVCKTDKPDVYHVHQSNKYVSTCLIPNMKTSRYMQDTFEDKQIGEMVTMNMKLHVNTNKYYPII